MPASIDPERLSVDASSSDGHTPTKQRGPVTLRRSQVQETTTDQRLLDSRGRPTGSTPTRGACCASRPSSSRASACSPSCRAR
jgi:hypothetical protein